jgi:hypothetical protein
MAPTGKERLKRECSVLVQAELRAASEGLRQVAHWVGFALLEFGVAHRSFKALLPNGVMANRERLPRCAISGAFGRRLRHAWEQKRNRSSHDYIGRSSPEDWLRHLGFLFN